jgi:hypothetical protein
MAALSSYAHAQVPAPPAYIPDVAEFDGGGTYSFPAHPALVLADGGTIEFWVSADWSEDPGYDPVVVANAGSQGALYAIAILGGRDGISLQAGDFIGALPFDFSDGEMHHVAVVDMVDAVAMMVDGRVIGSLDANFKDLPSEGLWVGTADGFAAPFIGAIAGLRIWDVALSRADLVSYSIADVDDPSAPHPDLEALVAESDFSEATLAFNPLYFDAPADAQIADILAAPLPEIEGDTE